MAAILVAQFSKTFPGGTVIAAELRLEVDTAPVTVLFGPSGSGKTTILRCLAGLERPDVGRIRCGDQTWLDTAAGVDVPPQRRRAGYLSQEYALFPHLTVARNIGFGVRGPRAARQARIDDLLQLVQLDRFAARYPAELSGGQQQRVALARALAVEPQLLLLDEPLAALDAPAREPLRRELRHLLIRCSIPTLLVTHDRIDALTLADRMLVVADGRIRQAGPVHEVFSRPADLTVARTVGVETVVPGHVVARGDGLLTVEVGAARLVVFDPGDVAGAVFVCIRAEDVALERGALSRTSARNHLSGGIVTLQSEGALFRVTIDCGFPLAALITRHACEDLALVVGETVTAVVKATSIHLIPRDGLPPATDASAHR